MSTFVGIPRIPTAAPETEMDPQDARGVRMAVSVLLDYPGDDFETKLNAVEEALADLPEPASSALASTSDPVIDVPNAAAAPASAAAFTKVLRVSSDVRDILSPFLSSSLWYRSRMYSHGCRPGLGGCRAPSRRLEQRPTRPTVREKPDRTAPLRP